LTRTKEQRPKDIPSPIYALTLERLCEKFYLGAGRLSMRQMVARSMNVSEVWTFNFYRLNSNKGTKSDTENDAAERALDGFSPTRLSFSLAASRRRVSEKRVNLKLLSASPRQMRRVLRKQKRDSGRKKNCDGAR
jgi:hypothetical protein